MKIQRPCIKYKRHYVLRETKVNLLSFPPLWKKKKFHPYILPYVHTGNNMHAGPAGGDTAHITETVAAVMIYVELFDPYFLTFDL